MQRSAPVEGRPRLDGKVDRKEEAERTEDQRQYDRESAVVHRGDIADWQRQDKAPVLDRGEYHGYSAEQYERDANTA